MTLESCARVGGGGCAGEDSYLIQSCKRLGSSRLRARALSRRRSCNPTSERRPACARQLCPQKSPWTRCHLHVWR
eukprot:1878463-Pyramimonas_sp.AAC.1